MDPNVFVEGFFRLGVFPRRGLEALSFPAGDVDDHSGPDRIVGNAVDDDKSAGGTILLVGIRRNGTGESQAAGGDVVELQMIHLHPLVGVDVDTVIDTIHMSGDHGGGTFEIVLSAHFHRGFVHPDDHHFELVGDPGDVVGVDQHIASADVDLVLRRQSYRHRRVSLFRIRFTVRLGDISGIDDPFDSGGLARGKNRNFVTHFYTARSDRPAKPPEIEMRAVDILHGKAEVLGSLLPGDIHRIEELQQRRPLVPGSSLAAFDDVVSLQGAHGDVVDMGNSQLARQFVILAPNLFEDLLAEIHQIHLVDRDDDMLDAQ